MELWKHFKILSLASSVIVKRVVTISSTQRIKSWWRMIIIFPDMDACICIVPLPQPYQWNMSTYKTCKSHRSHQRKFLLFKTLRAYKMYDMAIDFLSLNDRQISYSWEEFLKSLIFFTVFWTIWLLCILAVNLAFELYSYQRLSVMWIVNLHLTSFIHVSHLIITSTHVLLVWINK